MQACVACVWIEANALRIQHGLPFQDFHISLGAEGTELGRHNLCLLLPSSLFALDEGKLVKVGHKPPSCQALPCLTSAFACIPISLCIVASAHLVISATHLSIHWHLSYLYLRVTIQSPVTTVNRSLQLACCRTDSGRWLGTLCSKQLITCTAANASHLNHWSWNMWAVNTVSEFAFRLIHHAPQQLITVQFAILLPGIIAITCALCCIEAEWLRCVAAIVLRTCYAADGCMQCVSMRLDISMGSWQPA